MLVGTKFGEIRNVRFTSISGEGGASANCIKVQNSTRGLDKDGNAVPQAPVPDVIFSDIEVSSPLPLTGSESVIVENEINAGTLTNIRFENLVIRDPGNVAFVVKGGRLYR